MGNLIFILLVAGMVGIFLFLAKMSAKEKNEMAEAMTEEPSDPHA